MDLLAQLERELENVEISIGDDEDDDDIFVSEFRDRVDLKTHETVSNAVVPESSKGTIEWTQFLQSALAMQSDLIPSVAEDIEIDSNTKAISLDTLTSLPAHFINDRSTWQDHSHSNISEDDRSIIFSALEEILDAIVFQNDVFSKDTFVYSDWHEDTLQLPLQQSLDIPVYELFNEEVEVDVSMSVPLPALSDCDSQDMMYYPLLPPPMETIIETHSILDNIPNIAPVSILKEGTVESVELDAVVRDKEEREERRLRRQRLEQDLRDKKMRHQASVSLQIL
jgi:hypothetical protein